MIRLLFSFFDDKILVTIKGTEIHFANTAFGAQQATIDGLKLSKSGVEREFPDLKNSDRWREHAIHRFKRKLEDFKTEKEKADYISKDLIKFGYVLEQIQKGGFRPKKLK